MKINKVCMVGLGYIGLPTATVIASRGVDVAGVDIDPEIVATVNRGEIHINEPGLAAAVRAAVNNGHLCAYTEPQPADVFMIAVPTPFREGHQPDLSYIEAASRTVAKVLAPGNLVVLESTSPVGATELMAGWMAQERPDLTFPHQAGEASDIRVAHCPERVLPGKVMAELIANDRVIGGMTDACSAAAARLYEAFVEGEMIPTDVRTAEMCKLTENAFRDLNIAFANELSMVCDRVGIDPWELIRLANHHPRVNILQPGTGVGGHCIAVDPWFIISDAPEITPLMRTAREVNDSKPAYVVAEIKKALRGQAGKGQPAGKEKAAGNAGKTQPVVACLGIAFKPDVHDLRGSPALKVAETLADDEGLMVLVVEPHVTELPPSLAGRVNVELVSFDAALDRADIAAALVKHRALVDSACQRTLQTNTWLDFVNLLDQVPASHAPEQSNGAERTHAKVVPVFASAVAAGKG